MINTGSRDPLADKTWRCVSQNCSDKTDKIYGKTTVFTCCHQYLGFLEHGNVNICKCSLKAILKQNHVQQVQYTCWYLSGTSKKQFETNTAPPMDPLSGSAGLSTIHMLTKIHLLD